MMNFPGYKNVQSMYEVDNYTIYSALKDGKECVIKYLNKTLATNTDILAFQYEYELLKDVKSDYFIDVLEFQRIADSCFVTFNTKAHKSLEEVLQTKSFTLSEKLQLAIQMGELLTELKKHHFIHKAFTLSHILYDESNESLKLSNFSSAITLKVEKNIFQNPHAQSGELVYFSPEQTGRMNRNVDYRSDLYSCGVCLYQLFCDTLPFKHTNKLELFHAIIATEAIKPREIDEGIPEIIDSIIMKLLEKNAEDRYQTPYGLVSDIKTFIQKSETEDKPNFELALNDHTGSLQIPQKLFGRDKEVKILLDSFARISDGSKEMLLVAGYSGVGKSVLVNEVHKPITKQKGFFIEGKFDQFQKDKPYLALVQAFNSWVEHIMNESLEEQAKWRDELLAALGRNAQVIIDLVPAFEKLLNTQETVAELGGIEAQNRFNYLFSTLIETIASKDHPLVIFIDDLQWSDQATIHTLETLF